jgi:drug/metabolite transporter (DMT)-like permease
VRAGIPRGLNAAMRGADYVRLFALAAIWGGSFIFMRVLAPALGPVATAAVRVLTGGLMLLGWFQIRRFNPEWRQHGRHYAAIGIVNSAVPFSLYAFAALHVPAGYSAILNSTAPLFGAIFAALWLGEALTTRKILGLALGVSGVTLVAWRGAGAVTPKVAWSILACLTAAMCYGLSGVYIRKFARGVPSLGIAGCSQLCAGVLLSPSLAWIPTGFVPTQTIVLSIVGLGLLCSGVAYVIYYRLMTDVGPTRTLTVTFLVPIFGVLWGALFLGERITGLTLIGGALILAGTLLTVAPSPLRAVAPRSA